MGKTREVPGYQIFGRTKEPAPPELILDLHRCETNVLLPEMVLEQLATLMESGRLLDTNGQPYVQLGLHNKGRIVRFI